VAMQLWGVLGEPVRGRISSWPPLGIDENDTIYIPQTGPWGAAWQGFPDLLVWRLWSNAPSCRTALLAVVFALLVTTSLSAWYLFRTMGLPGTGWHDLLPPMRPAVVGALGIVALAFAVPALLTWAAIPNPQPELISRLPKQFFSYRWDSSFDRFSGQLYAPV